MVELQKTRTVVFHFEHEDFGFVERFGSRI